MALKSLSLVYRLTKKKSFAQFNCQSQFYNLYQSFRKDHEGRDPNATEMEVTKKGFTPPCLAATFMDSVFLPLSEYSGQVWL